MIELVINANDMHDVFDMKTLYFLSKPIQNWIQNLKVIA